MPLVVLGLLFDAAILGVVIAVVETRRFPGWPAALGCALAIGLTTSVLVHLLPDGLWPLAVVGAAGAGAFVIAHVCEIPLRRGAISAGAYLAVRLLMGLAWAAAR